MVLGLFPELNAAGGVQMAGRHLAAVLAEFAESRGTPYEFLSVNDPRGARELAVGLRRFSFRGFARAKGRFALRAAASASGSPTLILAAHPNLAPVAWLAARRRKHPHIVAVAHGIEVWQPLSPMRARALRRADVVLTPSADTAAKLVTVQRVERERIRKLPWALEPAFWQAAQAPRPTRPAGLPGGRLLLSVARLAASEAYKGLDTVITVLPRLAARVPDVRYVVVGDGDDLPRIQRLAARAGVADRVHFLGRIPPHSPELLACYAHADLFVLPSKGEGFGIAFLEAMAFGKPVVGGAHGGTPDVIEDGVCGYLVPHGDVDRLAGALERLLLDEAHRAELGRRARARVESHFLFAQFRERLVGILNELCAS